MPAFIEKRTHQRHKVLIPVEYDAQETGTRYSGEIINLSKNGLYLRSPAALGIDRDITLYLDGLPEEDNTHDAPDGRYNAVVKTCHILPKSGDSTYGVGVNLLEPLPNRDWTALFPPEDPLARFKAQPPHNGVESLRQRAENFLSRNAETVYRLGFENIQQLVHELYIHHIELQMQSDELRKAQEEIQATLSQYADLYDFAPVGYMTLDSSGLIEKINITAATFLGIERSHLIKRPLSNYIVKADQEIFWHHRRTVLESQTKQECEIKLRDKNDVIRYVQLQSTIEPNIEGIDQKIFTAVIDISERKIGEQQRKVLEERLADVHKMEAVGSLAGGMAHDFNNLMMGVQGSVSLMRLDLGANHPHREHLRNIDGLIRSGSKLTGQLLAFAQGGKYNVRPININDLIRTSVGLYASTRKDIEIKNDLQDNLGVIEADASQLEQVLLNLLINAGNAMPDGGLVKIQTRKVVLKSNRARTNELPNGNYIQIMVSDTGTGMDEETRKRIFEPFFTTKNLARGTGLGLASAYGTIINHRGFIDVFSSPGKGATFTIYLPITETILVEEVKEVQSSRAKRIATETILVVDDESRIRKVLSLMLERQGYTVMQAASGEEAIGRYQRNRNRIDLVILDMTMPGMDGRQTFERLRALDPHARVLLSSGYSQQGKAEDIIKSGCCGFIQKPYTLVALSQSLHDIFDQSRKEEPDGQKTDPREETTRRFTRKNTPPKSKK